VQVGDLVKIVAKDLRTPVGSLALVTRIDIKEDSRGKYGKCWARMVNSGHLFWFHPEYLEVISSAGR